MITLNGLSKDVYDDYFSSLLLLKPYLVSSVNMLPDATTELYNILQQTQSELIIELTNEEIRKSIEGIKKIFNKLKTNLIAFYEEHFTNKISKDISDKTSEHYNVPTKDIKDDGAEDFADLITNNRKNKLSVSDDQWGFVAVQKIIKTTFMGVVNKMTSLIGKTQNIFKRKKWVAVVDERTRHSHHTVNGTILKIDELFSVGDSLMEYPLDGSHGAGAKEIVNCRCTLEIIKRKGLF